MADTLPETAAVELAEVGRELSRQTLDGEIEVVTDPDEMRIVRAAAIDDGIEPEYSADQAKALLLDRRQALSS